MFNVNIKVIQSDVSISKSSVPFEISTFEQAFIIEQHITSVDF